MFRNRPPVIKMDYTYLFPFNTIATGYFKKYNYEPRIQLHTIAAVNQVDDDTLVYYRRREHLQDPVHAWERVTINRKNKTMTAENMGINSNGTEGSIDFHTFSPCPQHPDIHTYN